MNALSECLLTDEEKILIRVSGVVREQLELLENVPQYIGTTAIGYYQILYATDKQRNGVHTVRRANVFVATVAACVYYAFKHHHMPRTPTEICGLFSISRQLFSKGCHHLAVVQTLPLHDDTAELLFTRFANELGIPYSTIRYAINHLYTPAKPGINKYKPAAIAGGLICALLDINTYNTNLKFRKLTLREVCMHVGVCTSIVRTIKQLFFQHDTKKVGRNDGFDQLFEDIFNIPSPFSIGDGC